MRLSATLYNVSCYQALVAQRIEHLTSDQTVGSSNLSERAKWSVIALAVYVKLFDLNGNENEAISFSQSFWVGMSNCSIFATPIA